jgi:ergothioneine biosynthesis glutamate--cysteine ligase EgtA
MAAQDIAAVDAAVLASPAIGSIEDAHSYICRSALTSSPIGMVGLELEMHLVDLERPAQRISWERLSEIVAGLPEMPAGSSVTLEPGEQVELSTLPLPDVSTAVAALESDRDALATAFAEERLGLVGLGADPARAVRRLNPKARYAGMEAHFRATGSSDAGQAMMCSTAALQLNLNAGPSADWSERVTRMHRLGPVLVAMSACSPYLAGRASGWRSMRQQVWGEIDQARCGPLLVGEHPDEEWAAYALTAPVMLVRDTATANVTAMRQRIGFADWVSDPSEFGRRATFDDLDYHLSTLFPPVRPKGYLELRCIDAVPHRWWPGLAGIAVTLLDDPVAAARAAEICALLDDPWTAAAQFGLDDPRIGKAASECVTVAVERAPVDLAPAMAAYAELVLSGRTPGDEVRHNVESYGALAALEIEARAAAHHA